MEAPRKPCVRLPYVIVVITLLWFCLYYFHLASPITSHYPTGRRQAAKIILMAYGRSGSSFTADVIDRDHDVFYTFEPLYCLERRLMKHDSEVLDKNEARYNKEAISIMEIFLNCSFDRMKLYDIHNWQLRNSKDSNMLLKCARSFASLTSSISGCVMNARKSCDSHPVKMVKTVRLRGSAAAEMMARHHDLNIIYLVRDPRGTITSQRRVFGSFHGTNFTRFTKRFCRMFSEDLAHLEPLFDQYPNRMKLVRYESLAENPTRVFEELYRFLELDFTPAIRNYIINVTSAGRSSRGAYGTSKSNSTSAAYSWRRRISVGEAQTIHTMCKDIFVKFGYVPVKSQEELVSSNHSLKTSVTFHGTVI